MRNLLIAMVASMALIGCGAPSTPDFIQKAAMSDMYEVEAGKLAADKGQSDAVKQFGQQMVDAHTKTTEQLTGIVKTKNIKVDLPTKLDASTKSLSTISIVRRLITWTKLTPSNRSMPIRKR